MSSAVTLEWGPGCLEEMQQTNFPLPRLARRAEHRQITTANRLCMRCGIPLALMEFKSLWS